MIKTCEKLFRYLRMDISRGICSGGFLLGIAGVFLTLMFGTVDDITLDRTVFFVFERIQYGMPSMIVMLFCAYPYANSFCQDMENRYAYLMVQKGSVFLYTLSRSITIFLTALLTYSIGTMLFVMYLRYRMPWEDANFTSISLLQEVGGLRYFLTPGRYPVYFFLFTVQKGILAASLSLLAAYVSLYIVNSLLVLSIPVMGYYFLLYLGNSIWGHDSVFNVSIIFDASYNIWENDLASFLWPILLGVIFSGCLIGLIYKKVRGRIRCA